MDNEYDELDEFRGKINSTISTLEAILSGLFDNTVEYNDEQDEFEIVYPTKGRNRYYKETKMIFPREVSAKVCLETGGLYNSKTGNCKHKKR